MGVVGMPRDEAVLDPPDQGTFADPETRRGRLPRQQPSILEPGVTGAEPALVGEIGNPQGGEPRVGLSSPCRTAGTDSSIIQNVGDFGVDVIVEQRVDEFDHLGRGF